MKVLLNSFPLNGQHTRDFFTDSKVRASKINNREFKQTTTATVTRAWRKKRANEQENGLAHAF